MPGLALILSLDDSSILKMVSIVFPANVSNWKLRLFLFHAKHKKGAECCDTAGCVGAEWEVLLCHTGNLILVGRSKLGLPRYTWTHHQSRMTLHKIPLLCICSIPVDVSYSFQMMRQLWKLTSLVAKAAKPSSVKEQPVFSTWEASQPR